jgi:hypothetical protein
MSHVILTQGESARSIMMTLMHSKETLSKCYEHAQLREAAQRDARHIIVDRRAASEHATKQMGGAVAYSEFP